jgi:hypothetical protein
MRNVFFIVAVFTLSVFTNAQQVEKQNLLTGNLSVDSKIALSNYEQPVNPQVLYPENSRKSPLLAGVMSAVIPGLGEIYTEEYLKAGIFVVIEAAVISTAVVFDKKGDNKTTEFQNYADDYTNPKHHWSVVDYAEWLANNKYPDPNDIELKEAFLDNIIISSNTNLPPWERVNWAQLNAAETGSHKLPPHGEQQYYELIGKYHQYSSGWNDFTGGPDKEIISPNFLFYSDMRGDANSYYSTASTAVIGIYVNHILSSLDAIWSATRFNKNLTVKVRLDNIQMLYGAEFYPALYVTYKF